MKKLKVRINKDMFSDEKAYMAFVNGEDGWDWHYNISKNIFGYGDDVRDWDNEKDEYICASQILEIFETKNKGEYMICYEEEIKMEKRQGDKMKSRIKKMMKFEGHNKLATVKGLKDIDQVYVLDEERFKKEIEERYNIVILERLYDFLKKHKDFEVAPFNTVMGDYDPDCLNWYAVIETMGNDRFLNIINR